jgi:hypothetical protein
MSKYILLAFFLGAFSSILSAQDNVKQVLTDLKKGVLLVRLPTTNNKLKTIEGYLKDPALLPKERARWEKMLHATQEETQLLTSRMVEAVTKRYTFSNYTFIYDTAVVALLKGKTTGLFVDKDGNSNPLSVENTPFFILKYGKLTNVTGFIIADKNNQDFDKKWALSIHWSEGEWYSGLLFAASVGINLEDVPSSRKMQKAIRTLNKNLMRKG